MLKIKKLESGPCINLLNQMFKKFGIKPLDPKKKMPYWVVKLENEERCLLQTPILSVDEDGNVLQAVFFTTRKKTEKHLKLFRFTELYSSLHLIEKDVTIEEAIDRFVEEMTDYIKPVTVVLLGKIFENGELYTGGFLYKVPLNDIIIEAEDPEVTKEVEEEND